MPCSCFTSWDRVDLLRGNTDFFSRGLLRPYNARLVLHTVVNVSERGRDGGYYILPRCVCFAFLFLKLCVHLCLSRLPGISLDIGGYICASIPVYWSVCAPGPHERFQRLFSRKHWLGSELSISIDEIKGWEGGREWAGVVQSTCTICLCLFQWFFLGALFSPGVSFLFLLADRWHFF